MTPYTYSTSCTCRKAVPPGPPFGRRAQQVCGLLAEKLTSLKVLLSLSLTFWITDACTSPPCRFQFEHGKPSNSTYFCRLLDASRQPAHADWVSHLSVFMLGSRVSEKKNDRTTLTTDCSAAADGCTVNFNEASTPASYGSEFNNEGGGFYVMSNTQASGIQIWYWPRLSPSSPEEITSGDSLTPNDAWGTPAANFPMVPGYCDYSEYFNAQQIIFDLTFCVSALRFNSLFLPECREWLIYLSFSTQGDFAGLTWDQSSCASLSPTCAACE